MVARSATGALESRLAKIEGGSTPTKAVDVSDEGAFERMRQAAKASVLDGDAPPPAGQKKMVF